MYKQSIIFFGILLPMLFLAVVAGGGFYIKSQMTESFAVKTAQYRTFNQSRNAAMEIEKNIQSDREHILRWKQDLATETTSNVRNHLKAITEKLPPKEFQETGFDPLTTKSSFASASKQKSSQFRLGFRGTFRAAEKALLELEARMPQLLLQEMKMTPSDQSSLINFQVTYTAWEN